MRHAISVAKISVIELVPSCQPLKARSTVDLLASVPAGVAHSFVICAPAAQSALVSRDYERFYN
jgi:hypothetical protein